MPSFTTSFPLSASGVLSWIVAQMRRGGQGGEVEIILKEKARLSLGKSQKDNVSQLVRYPENPCLIRRSKVRDEFLKEQSYIFRISGF